MKVNLFDDFDAVCDKIGDAMYEWHCARETDIQKDATREEVEQWVAEDKAKEAKRQKQ